MKLLDEKGRLFGIINVFDLLVLCIIVSLAFFAIKWVRTAEDPSWTRVKTFYTRCYIITNSIKPYVAELVEEGDEMLNEDGLVVARIKRILSDELTNPPESHVYLSKDGDRISVRPNAIIISSNDGDKFFFKSVNSKNVQDAEIKRGDRRLMLLVDILSYEKQDESWSCITNMPIKIGDTFIIYTKKYNIYFNICKVLTNAK